MTVYLNILSIENQGPTELVMYVSLNLETVPGLKRLRHHVFVTWRPSSTTFCFRVDTILTATLLCEFRIYSDDTTLPEQWKNESRHF